MCSFHSKKEWPFGSFKDYYISLIVCYYMRSYIITCDYIIIIIITIIIMYYYILFKDLPTVQQVEQDYAAAGKPEIPRALPPPK